jgi:CRISPR type I-D-associated protein Csc1
MTERLRVLEVDITTTDNLYYVSRESGNRFSVKPYVMHTALYYAFDILPSRFRCAEQTPFYDDDKDEAEGLYVHPAVSRELEGYETRRFAVKGDSYRTESQRLNRNLMETGYQKSILPGSKFRTYIVSEKSEKTDDLVADSPMYVRIGKKMASSKVEVTDLGRHEPESGDFELSQPVSTNDLDFDDEYDLLGNLRWERMNPVDLLVEGELNGSHLSFTVPRGRDEERVELPANAEFLGG